MPSSSYVILRRSRRIHGPFASAQGDKGTQGDKKSNECHCEELSKESDVAIHGPFASAQGDKGTQGDKGASGGQGGR